MPKNDCSALQMKCALHWAWSIPIPAPQSTQHMLRLAAAPSPSLHWIPLDPLPRMVPMGEWEGPVPLSIVAPPPTLWLKQGAHLAMCRGCGTSSVYTLTLLHLVWSAVLWDGVRNLAQRCFSSFFHTIGTQCRLRKVTRKGLHPLIISGMRCHRMWGGWPLILMALECD